MAEYLKEFNTTSSYNTYMGGSDKKLPNTSFVKQEYMVHYTPPVETLVKGIIVSTGHTTKQITNPNVTYEQVWLNGNKIGSRDIDRDGTISLGTGNHIVKYEFPLNTSSIPARAFSILGIKVNIPCDLSEVYIPDQVALIGEDAFRECPLRKVVIGSGITTIGNSAFYGCGNLTEMTIWATTPPSYAKQTFYGIRELTVYVPSSALTAYVSQRWDNIFNLRAIPGT